MGFFSKGLKNEFETVVVDQPSVFEPLKFYCTCFKMICNFLGSYAGAVLGMPLSGILTRSLGWQSGFYAFGK